MINPAFCPMCRRRFDMVKVKKLHVDRYSPPERTALGLPADANDAETDTHHEALALLQSLAMINLERTPLSQVESTMRSVDNFLESQSEEEPVVCTGLSSPPPQAIVAHLSALPVTTTTQCTSRSRIQSEIQGIREEVQT
jgi:hypothetical protein